MKDLKEFTRLALCLSLCFLFFSITESNAQVKKMSSKDLTEKSTAVLYGKCKSKKCAWNENKSAIYTYITITPEEYIKGNLGTEVVVAVPGGRVDNMLYEVSETPFFTVDEDVVAFVWTNPKGKNLITGGFQGKMKIEKDAKTGKRFVNDPDADSETSTQNLAPGQVKKSEKMQLEDFVGKLKGYMKH
jgi:hypothetical protein